jgi:carbamoyltransferase
LLYSAFTHYCGFNPNADEYKLMGLAPYGEPAYVDIIFKKILKMGSDRVYRVNPDYFNYRSKHKITNKKFSDLFGGPPRKEIDAIERKHKDLARSVQVVTEIALMDMVNRLQREAKLDNLCMAGEMALNCVANGRILREGPFKRVWIQPASSDAGCALGAALMGWHKYLDHPRKVRVRKDLQKMSFLGPRYSDEEIEMFLTKNNIKYKKVHTAALLKKVAGYLNAQKIVGWFQGRMEFGPRALGNRSILADPRSNTMRDIVNKRVKFREPFRPFAPSVLSEKAGECFDLERESPYMLFVSPVKSKGFPAITHIDNSARVQTVKRADNPIFYDLLSQFYRDYGCPMVINTSFNIRGEPIVSAPEDAYRCFMRSDMDYLAIGSFLIEKNK